jgi:hypothetical protein
MKSDKFKFWCLPHAGHRAGSSALGLCGYQTGLQDRKREKKYHLVAHGYKAAKDTMVVYSISEHILTLRGIQCDKLTTAGKLMVDFSFQPEWSDTFEAAILQSEF